LSAQNSASASATIATPPAISAAVPAVEVRSATAEG
jgi:hypothetical protein